MKPDTIELNAEPVIGILAQARDPFAIIYSKGKPILKRARPSEFGDLGVRHISASLVEMSMKILTNVILLRHM